MARYLAILLEYLIAKIGIEVMDWSLRQVIDWFRSNPDESVKAGNICANRYIVEPDYDPDLHGYFWERKH